MNFGKKKVLITGGAGFIGQRLATSLISQGAEVRILDSFSVQIHAISDLPVPLKNSVELIRADIRDRDSVRKALLGSEVVVHLAAETGTGQSMYEINKYFDVNCQGTAVLLDLIQNDVCSKTIESIVVASSRAVYGEGAYECIEHGYVFPKSRTKISMSSGIFDPICPDCGSFVKLIPTSERAPFMPMSIYGLTKQVQEQSVLLLAEARGINAFALRYQNVYGPGQSLKNPYTGILAIFANLARQNQTIEIYEDGQESRDFIYIDDVIEATMRAIYFKGDFIGALNVGSGNGISVNTVAGEICKFFGSQSKISVSGNFRVGDIRHNVADISSIQKTLNFTPKVPFFMGVTEFLKWAADQPLEDINAYRRSVAELSEKGLMGIGRNS